MIQIYHNARCGKSRTCLLSLQNSGKNFEIINYLETTPTFDELSIIIKKLNIKAIELIRTKEKIWISNYKSRQLSDDEIITAMIENPILIERPIVIDGEKARIARTDDAISEII